MPPIEESASATDAALVARLQAGDDSTLSILMERHQRALYFFALRTLRDESLAGDVTQETFVRAYFNIRRYRPTASFKTWLYTIAVNLCRDQVRRMMRRPSFVSLDHGMPDGRTTLARHLPSPEADPAVAAVTAERHALLQAAIAALPDELREALLLFVFEDLSQKECAEILGLSPKAVELRVYRAKKALQQILADQL